MRISNTAQVVLNKVIHKFCDDLQVTVLRTVLKFAKENSMAFSEYLLEKVTIPIHILPRRGWDETAVVDMTVMTYSTTGPRSRPVLCCTKIPYTLYPIPYCEVMVPLSVL